MGRPFSASKLPIPIGDVDPYGSLGPRVLNPNGILISSATIKRDILFLTITLANLNQFL